MFDFTFQFSDLQKAPFWMGISLLLFSVFPQGNSFANTGESVMDLTCPENIFVTPPDGECMVPVDFSNLEWSSSETLVDTVFSPGSLSIFSFGTNTVTLTVTTTGGDELSCNFQVNVLHHATTPQCVGSQNVHFGDSCQITLTPKMFLEGGPYDCEENYSVEIIAIGGGDLGDVITPEFLGDSYVVSVMDNFTFEECSTIILPLPDNLPQTIICPPDITVGCHEPNGPPVAGEPTWVACFPDSLMELEFADDLTVSFCDGDDVAFQVARTWTVKNPYNGKTSCTQIISGRRVALTEILFPPDYDGTDLPPLTCSDTLGAAMLADTSITGRPLVEGFSPSTVPCHLVISYTDSIENICGSEYHIMRTWEAYDYCEQVTIDHIQFIDILDEEPPLFTLPQTIYASSNDVCGGFSNLPSINLEHECSPFDVLIETPWGDVFANGGIVAAPDSNGIYEVNYTATDSCDNSASLAIALQIRDEVIAACPPGQSITSEYYLENLKSALDTGDLSPLAEFGYPDFAINCSQVTLTENLQTNLDDCTEGSLVRTFGTEEAAGTCDQIIHVQHVSDFVVEFPMDTTVACGAAVAAFGQPLLKNENVEIIEVEYTDQIFPAVTDICTKILRTWVVKNTCVTGNADDEEVIEISEAEIGLAFPDCDFDGDGDCDSLTFRDSWTSTQMPGEAEASNFQNPDTDTDSDPWDGFITHIQTIRVMDTVPPVFTQCSIPDVCITGQTCTTPVMIPLPAADDCQGAISESQLSAISDLGIGFGPFLDVPAGTYGVTYFAVDNCGNDTTCETTLKVVDCTPPTPVCNTQIVLPLSTNSPPSISMFAGGLNAGSLDNCPGGLQFSFSADDSGDVGRVFFCEDVGQHVIPLYVSDLSGNTDSCDIFVVIEEAFSGQCNGDPPTNFISGNIQNEQAAGIEGVSLSSTEGFSIATDVDGGYSIGFDGQVPLTLTPSLDSNPMNGVTTFDALLIVKHVLGTEALSTPYKIIAADVNGTNSVTTFDAVRIRQMVLGNITEFAAGSWRFVPVDYQFTNPQLPFSDNFPEALTFTSPPSPNGHDFIGFKVGDLNGSATPNLLGGVNDRSFKKDIKFSLSDIYVKKEKAILVPVMLPENELHGFQFALGFDPAELEIMAIEPGLLTAEAFGKNQLGDGILKTSWLADEAISPSDNTPAFTLRILPKKEGKLSEMLRLERTAMPAEAYSAELERMNVALVFAPQKLAGSSFQAYPNRPDPFSASTLIPFEIPEAGEVELQVFSPSGQTVAAKSRYFAEGYHELEIRADELPGAGIYFYKIHSPHGSAEGRMVRR